MKVMVLGGGGREHAVVHALSKSKITTELHCCPGNPGIAKLALCHADDLGFERIWWQEGGTVSESFVPAFDATGVRGPELGSSAAPQGV